MNVQVVCLLQYILFEIHMHIFPVFLTKGKISGEIFCHLFPYGIKYRMTLFCSIFQQTNWCLNHVHKISPIYSILSCILIVPVERWDKRSSPSESQFLCSLLMENSWRYLRVFNINNLSNVTLYTYKLIGNTGKIICQIIKRF